MNDARGSNRRSQPGGWAESRGTWLMIGLVVVVLAVAYTAVHVGHRLAGLTDTPADPWVVLFGLLDRSVAWPRESTYVAAAGLVLVLALAGVTARAASRRRRRTSRVDWTANYLGSGREVEGISAKTVRATAKRLGVDGDSPGVPIGRTVADRQRLFGSWEDMQILIAGPRVGKSVSFGIPAILAAPGAVLATSNKRDIVDATRDLRAARGPVWVFDPQGIVKEPTTLWWWNPLSYVTDEVTAANLADHFDAGSRSVDSKTDSFFDVKGRDLLADLLLAAALDEQQITVVHHWLTRPTQDEPADILARHGFVQQSDRVSGVIQSPEKQRGGIYATAERMATCLTTRSVLQWVTDDGTGRQHFDPAAFVRDGGTLYSLSREGRGTAGPLVTALTVAIVEAAEELATTQPGGRLRLPMLGVLDEAANVCRWRDLPDLYSHYGSRGIILVTILQSWSQGEEVWGERGMKKLWSASNVAIYAGGVKEVGFLEMLSKLLGDYDSIHRSVSTRANASMLGSSGAQTSRDLRSETILKISDLAEWPRGRAIAMSSGNRSTIVETLPWMTGPHAAAVEASIKAHDPEAEKTLREAAESLLEVDRELRDADGRSARPGVIS